MSDLLDDTAFLREVFDAIPAAVLIVDEDVRILHLNDAATKELGLKAGEVFHKRGGDVLHCLHAEETKKGCGHATACKDCLVRNAARTAIQGGKTYRKATRMEFVRPEGSRLEQHLLVTAAAFRHRRKDYALLTLENVSELVQLRSLLPICMYCKRIKDDAGYWNDVATYLSEHLDVDFSHGVCDECRSLYYTNAGYK